MRCLNFQVINCCEILVEVYWIPTMQSTLDKVRFLFLEWILWRRLGHTVLRRSNDQDAWWNFQMLSQDTNKCRSSLLYSFLDSFRSNFSVISQGVPFGIAQEVPSEMFSRFHLDLSRRCFQDSAKNILRYFLFTRVGIPPGTPSRNSSWISPILSSGIASRFSSEITPKVHCGIP